MGENVMNDITPDVERVLAALAGMTKLPDFEEKGIKKATTVFEICNNLVREVIENNPGLTWENNRSDIISFASKLAEERFADKEKTSTPEVEQDVR